MLKFFETAYALFRKVKKGKKFKIVKRDWYLMYDGMPIFDTYYSDMRWRIKNASKITYLSSILQKYQKITLKLRQTRWQLLNYCRCDGFDLKVWCHVIGMYKQYKNIAWYLYSREWPKMVSFD